VYTQQFLKPIEYLMFWRFISN